MSHATPRAEIWMEDSPGSGRFTRLSTLGDFEIDWLKQGEIPEHLRSAQTFNASLQLTATVEEDIAVMMEKIKSARITGNYMLTVRGGKKRNARRRRRARLRRRGW